MATVRHPPSEGCVHVLPTAHCLRDLLGSRAELAPQAPAILAPGRAPLSYAGLWRQVRSTVAALNAAGIVRGDRVAIVLPNGPEMAVALLAVAAGATAAPLNPDCREGELDFHLADLGARALIVPAGAGSPAREVARSRGIAVLELAPDTRAEAGVFSLSGGASPPVEPAFAQPGDVALVLHTSGTTSRPKLGPLTKANLCASAANTRAALALTAADRCLNVMPLFHIHGLVGALLSSLAAGGSVVCTPGFDACRFLEWLAEFGPTWYTAVPTMHQAVLARAEAQREPVVAHSLRLIRSCSSALPPRVMAGLEAAFGVPVIEAYGMTEASHQMTCNPLPPGARKPGSVGVAAGPEVAIMDGAAGLLPPRAPGEIVIRGPNVTPGYVNNPAANEAAFAGGWFRTGDQGYLDEEGYLYLTGRLKELINRGGEKISPREVDEVLLDHPAVAQAVAFAAPHPTLGEQVAAAVVLREGAAAGERELREFAAQRLAGFKVPSRILIVSEIPKGPTGKLQRIGLAEKLGLTAGAIETAQRPPFVGPRNAIEELLAGLWTQVLGLENVGVHDDFVALGGDSILATQVIARLRDAIDVELSPLRFFEGPTVAAQAAAVEELLWQEMGGSAEEGAGHADHASTR